MMWWPAGWGWGWGVVMMLGMVLFWALVAWAVVAIVRSNSAPRESRTDAEDILGKRFALGEIDETEYRSRLDTLRTARGKRVA